MFLQFLRQLDHLFRSYCGFVSGLGGRKKGKLRATLILDQRLLETAVSLDDIHHIVDDPVFQPQNHIQIPKTDVCIDDHGPLFHTGQAHSDICCSGGLSHAAFSRCYHNDFTHSFASDFHLIQLLVWSSLVFF